MIDNILERISAHALPPLATRVLELIEDDKSHVQSLAEVINSDSSFAIRLLVVANSAHSLPYKITTVFQAINLLGFETIKFLALGLTFYPFSSLKKRRQAEEEEASSKKEVSLKDLWEHSLGCAVSARLIASRIHYESPQSIYTGGLFHDVGQILFYRQFKEEFFRAVRMAEEKEIPLSEAENLIFGADHAAAGEAWAQTAKVPPLIRQAIRLHHQPLLAMSDDLDPSLQKAVAIIHVADNLSPAPGVAHESQYIPDEIWTFLGLSESLCRELLRPVKQTIEMTRKLFAIVERLEPPDEIPAPETPKPPGQAAPGPRPKGHVIKFPTKENRPRSGKEEKQRSITLLVVEDHGSLSEMLTLYFMRHGYHVRAAGDGETALKILAEEEIDLILLDLMLPRMDGFEMMRRLKRQNRAKLPYIIVLSARAADEDKKRVMELGANEYLSKPFHLLQLLERIQAVQTRLAESQDEQQPQP